MSKKLKLLVMLLSVIGVILFITLTNIICDNNKNAEIDNSIIETENIETIEETAHIEIKNVEETVVETNNKETKDEIAEETTNEHVTEEYDVVVETATMETEVAETENVEKVNEEPNIVSLGEFRLTAYCKCEVCCGKWINHPTASGVMPTVNRTISVDTNVIPFGTEIMIDGNIYVAEDTGSAIKGNRIDVYMSDHQTALEFGVQYKEVFKVE